MSKSNTPSLRFTREDLETRDAIGVIVRDAAGRILVQDHVKLDFWTIPIGKVKSWEKPEEAMMQELREELGIEVIKFEKIGICKGEYDYDGVMIRIRTHIFEVMDYHGDVCNLEPKKHRSIEFKSLDEVRELPRLSDATKWALKNYRSL